MSLASQAADPDQDLLEFACILNCPRGLSIHSSTGLITWRPDLDQVGEATPTIRVTANGQSAVANLSIQVLAPQLQLQFAPISAISGDSVSIHPTVQSNLAAPYQYLISQTSGPHVSLLGGNGNWTFEAPLVQDTVQLSFDIQVGNGRFTTQQTFNTRIDPQPIAPTVDVGGARLSREPILVSAVVSPNSKTLAWSALSGPGRVTFSENAKAETTISADIDGLYVIALKATNSWGQETVSSFPLTWDTSAPQIEVGQDAISRQGITRTAQIQGAQTLLWSKLSGPGTVEFSATNAASTNISADRDGDYVIQLEAHDAAGNVSRDEFRWTYDHTPPTISLGDSILMQTKSKALKATVSDDALTIAWKKFSGPSTVGFSPANLRDSTVTFGGDGVFVIEVSASDALGNTASAQLQVSVDTLPPQIASVTLGAVVADGFLNPIEKAQAKPLVGLVTVNETSPYTLAYKIVGSTSTCTSTLVYSASAPNSDDAAINKAAAWKICVKATDSFNLSSYAASPSFTYDTTSVLATVTGLPANPTRATDLQVIVAGKSITHYRSKVGPAENTNCAIATDYSLEAPIATLLTTDYKAFADGLLRLCVIGRTATGNWQDLSVATRFDWTLDRLIPRDPGNLNVVPLVERARLSWDLVENADSYLIVRSEDKSATWVPTSGQAYAVDQEVDDDHKIVAIASAAQAFDDSAQGAHTYHYALFAFDKSLNYNMNPTRASTTIIESLTFNKANGFDRLVRVVVPIHEGEHKGKMLVGGDFLVYQTDPAVRLMRLNADLTLDTSFKPALINASVYALAIASDGSIYLGGSFTTVGGKVRNRIAKLSANGALDESFVPPGFNNTVLALALDNDESRLYVGGQYTALVTPVTPANRLAALRTVDGALDTGFALKESDDKTKIGFNSTIWSLATDPTSSEIYVGGQFTDYGGVTLGRIVKLDETGEVDSSISLGAGFDNTIVTLKMDSKQRLYVGGSFTKYRGSSYYARLVRLKTDGMPDTDFNKGLSNSTRFNNTVRAVELDEVNNRVYVGGDFTAYGTNVLTRMARLSMADGTLDSSFASTANGSVQTLALNEQGLLFGGGSFQIYSGQSASYFFVSKPTGALDEASPSGSTFNSNVFATLRVYEDQQNTHDSVKYFLAGSFTTYNGVAANRVVKLDRLGNIDSSFVSQVTNGTVYAMAWDDVAKKLYVAGNFTQVNAVVRNRIARLNANGSLDTTYVPDGFNSDVYALALASNPATGKKWLYVGGKFTTIGTQTTGRFVRLNHDGSLDGNFVTGSGFDNNVNALAVSYTGDDHSVYVGGAFLKYNSSVANTARIVKLASDGSIASGFEPGGGFNGSIQALLWMPGEGALYVGGAFTRYQTTIVANRIAKLDATGGVSVGFNSSTGFNSTVYALDYDGDNDVIWAGGAFTQFRSINQGRIAAMLRDGNRLAAFQAPVGFNGDVRAVTSSYWGVMTGGLGSSYEGDVCGFAARLLPNGTMN